MSPSDQKLREFRRTIAKMMTAVHYSADPVAQQWRAGVEGAFTEMMRPETCTCICETCGGARG